MIAFTTTRRPARRGVDHGRQVVTRRLRVTVAERRQAITTSISSAPAAIAARAASHFARVASRPCGKDTTVHTAAPPCSNAGRVGTHHG